MLSAFKRLKYRITDVKTITKLCTRAEEHAIRRSEGAPSTEHFLLAAIEMPDGSAHRVLESLGLTAKDIEQALNRQHVEALAELGMAIPEDFFKTENTNAPKPRLYRADSIVDDMFKSMEKRMRETPDRPLLGVDVMLELSNFKQGTTARVWQTLSVTPERLKQAINDEVAKH